MPWLTAFQLAQAVAISPCPCILVNIFGARIRFSISVLLEDLIVCPVTEWLGLSSLPNKPERLERLCQVFVAAREAVDALRTYYLSLLTERANHPRTLPQPSFLANAPSRPFVFLDRLRDPKRDETSLSKPVFSARLDERPVVVKFTDRYNATAHHLLAKGGYAPYLHHVAHLEGGGYMVVMDVAPGVNGLACLDGMFLPDDSAFNDVQAAVRLLHASDIVHGDIRLSNIMLRQHEDGDWHAQLIDFDWAGQDREARYPSNLDEYQNWAPGVVRNGVMKKNHDFYRLEMVRPQKY